MPRTEAGRRRCAIYTRKSSEEGLEQEFNSLAAQREACEAYIRSQQHEGWVLARPRYDDGGFSGGNLERPALQRLRPRSVRGIAALARLTGCVRDLRWRLDGRPVLFQSEEERSRPRCASDLSRNSGKRTVMRALPREALIEHEHLIGSALPLPNEPGSRFQFEARTAPDLSGFFELLCELTELALVLRAEPAKSDFLHPVGDC